MMTRAQLAALLRDVNVAELAAEAKVAAKTIYRLRNQEVAPTLDTLNAILSAAERLKRHPEAKAA